MISRRQKIFFLPLIERLHCAEKFRITGVGSAHNYFSDAPLGQIIYFSNFSHADNFFPNRNIPWGK